VLDHRRISRSLAGASIGHQIDYHSSLTSTNDRALALARQGYPHGLVVLADSQTAGRGRRGNDWESPAGLNLYMTVLLRPGRDLSVPRWPRLTTLIALALCRAIEEEIPELQALIKWPNDIYLGDRKVAGILAESGQENDGVGGEGSRFVVLGTGVNVHARPEDLSAELRARATSLATAAPRFACSREAVAISYLRHLAALLPEIESGFGVLLGEVSTRSWLLGRDVVWNSESGAHSGHALGLDSDGQLRVRLPDGSEQSLGSVESIRIRE